MYKGTNNHLTICFTCFYQFHLFLSFFTAVPSCNSARICWAEGPIETLCSSKCRRVTADELIARNLALVRNGESRDKACAFETHMITYKLWLSKNGKHIKKRTYTAELNRWNTRLCLKIGYPQFQWIIIIFPTKMVGGYAVQPSLRICVYIYIYIHYIYMCVHLRFQYPTISNTGYPSHIPHWINPSENKTWFSARPELPERNMFTVLTQYGITIHGIENITDGI